MQLTTAKLLWRDLGSVMGGIEKMCRKHAQGRKSKISVSLRFPYIIPTEARSAFA